MSKNKGFSRVMALVLLICMVVSFAPAAYADVDEAPAMQEETVVEESTVKKPVSEEEAPVEENDAETPEQPAVPSGSNSIKELFKFHCTADDTHADQTYNWFGSYVKYNNDMAYDAARGVWTATANITNVQTLLSTGVKAPNKVWGKTHYHTDVDGNTVRTATIKLVWDANATGQNASGTETTGLWLPDGGVQTVDVWCATAPAAPTIAGSFTRSAGSTVAVRIQDSAYDIPKYAKSYSKVTYFRYLKEGTYKFTPVTKDENGDYWCDLIIDPTSYIDEFNTANKADPAFRLDPNKPLSNFTYKMKYTGSKTDFKTDGSGWSMQSSSYDKTIGETAKTGKVAYVSQYYIVKYTDGVGGKAFADQTYYAAPNGATPAFNGTPTRTNYNFIGWDTTVADTVTGDVTYTAVWEIAEPVVPSGANSAKELFKFHCTVDDTHADQTYNWFGNYVKYNNDKTYDAERGVWTASANITNVQTLLSTGVKAPNKVWGKTHYHTDVDGNTVRTATIKLVWDANATGQNASGTETTGLWLPDGGVQTVDVWCATAPAAPTIAALPRSTKSSTAIRVQNSTVPFDPKNTRDTVSSNVHYFRDLKEGTYEFTPVTKDENGDFWCTLKITDFAPYVTKFNTRNNNPTPAYRIDEELTTATFEWTLKYTGSKTDYKQDGSGWSIQSSSWAKGETSRTGKLLYVSQYYTVTYTDGINGEVFADQSYTVRLGKATPAFNGTPEREGYVFKGWAPTVAETVTGNVTYVAQWEAKGPNTLRYNANGGPDEEDVVTTDEASIVVKEDVPNYPGFDFKGWNTQANGKGTSYKAGDTVSFTAVHNEEEITLFAQWKSRPANTIYYNANGGEGGPVNNFSNAIYATVQTGVPTRVGYTFVCWNTESDGSGDSYKGGDKYYFTAVHNGEKVTLYAQWKANDYTLSRDSNGGDELADVTVTMGQPYGDAIVASPRAGYTEDGWFLIVDDTIRGTEIKADTEVAMPDNHRIFLKRSIAPVTVTVSEDITKDYDGEEIVLTASTEEYTGLRYAYQWYKDGEVLAGKNDKTLTLDGNVADSGVYTVKLTVTNAQDSGVITENDDVSTEAEVKVVVNKVNNSLTYNYNGADEKDSTVETTESTVTVDADKEITRKGYDFLGWNTKADGTGDSYKSGDELTFVDNGNGGEAVTLYAQWKGKEYKLTFKIKEDPDFKEDVKLNFTSKTVVYGEKVGQFPYATRKDHILVWYDKDGKRVNSETVYLVEGDSTYTGVWTEYKPVVATGDSSNIALYAAAMFASIACIGAGVILLRRKREE